MSDQCKILLIAAGCLLLCQQQIMAQPVLDKATAKVSNALSEQEAATTTPASITTLSESDGDAAVQTDQSDDGAANATLVRAKRKYLTKLQHNFQQVPVSYIAPQPPAEVQENTLLRQILQLLNWSEQKYLDNLMRVVLDEEKQVQQRYGPAKAARPHRQRQRHQHNDFLAEPQNNANAAHVTILPMPDNYNAGYDISHDVDMAMGGQKAQTATHETAAVLAAAAAAAAATGNEHLLVDNTQASKEYDESSLFYDNDAQHGDNLHKKALLQLLQKI